MARRGLCNVVRETYSLNGQQCWRLLTKDGLSVPAFDVFCAKNTNYAFRTQKRYAEVVSRFIDYLYQAGVFDTTVTPSYLNAVIDAYPILLSNGAAVTAARISESDANAWLAEVANGLDWDPIMSNSFSNVIAPVNRFLRLSESLAREAREKAALLGIGEDTTHQNLICALNGTSLFSHLEIAAMKQNTMFGNVAKYVPKGIQRPKGLRKPGGPNKATRKVLDFPRESFPSLINAAETWRDKSLWLLLGATGIRISEALSMLLADVDFEHHQVFVLDPNSRRPQLGTSDPIRFRFKGREVAYTYPIPELRHDLFYALTQYLNQEFVPVTMPGTPSYLFQYVDQTRRGQPLIDCSYAALTQNFKRAVRNAGISNPADGREWSIHSLRHMYGVYMLNDFPVSPASGIFGLPLVDVQMMMGHARIHSTAHYARSKHHRLAAKLEACDIAIHGWTKEELAALPSFSLGFVS
jgi:integrase